MGGGRCGGKKRGGNREEIRRQEKKTRKGKGRRESRKVQGKGKEESGKGRCEGTRREPGSRSGDEGARGRKEDEMAEKQQKLLVKLPLSVGRRRSVEGKKTFIVEDVEVIYKKK